MMKIFKTYITTKELYIIKNYCILSLLLHVYYTFILKKNPSTPSRLCIEIGCMVNIFKIFFGLVPLGHHHLIEM